MTWENKVEMIRLLNDKKYEEAVKIFSEEPDWDEQAVEMFLYGFDLNEFELLRPIKDRLLATRVGDLRMAIRLAYLDNYLNP